MDQIAHPSAQRRLSPRRSLRWSAMVILAASAVIGGALPASAVDAPVSVGGPELPATGTQVGLLAILGALALLLLGLVVLLLARRNRH